MFLEVARFVEVVMGCGCVTTGHTVVGALTGLSAFLIFALGISKNSTIILNCLITFAYFYEFSPLMA